MRPRFAFACAAAVAACSSSPTAPSSSAPTTAGTWHGTMTLSACNGADGRDCSFALYMARPGAVTVHVDGAPDGSATVSISSASQTPPTLLTGSASADKLMAAGVVPSPPGDCGYRTNYTLDAARDDGESLRGQFTSSYRNPCGVQGVGSFYEDRVYTLSLTRGSTPTR